MMMDENLRALESHLKTEFPIAVAVSGGVDSMTLAVVTHRLMPDRACVFHAVSPAVPPEATERVKRYAASEGWVLTIVDTGEFRDTDYIRNPVDRCFYCKTNLYGAIASRTDAGIVSGANTDDLGEYRPGLNAAKDHNVRHPYIECGLSKPAVRAISHALGLTDLAELPAAPCLASSIETGIEIQPETLERVHTVEKLVTQSLSPMTVRCRVRSRGVVVELDNESLRRMTDLQSRSLCREVARIFKGVSGIGKIHFETYRTGSAFVGDKS